jgi:hypothetical protein
MEPPPRSLALDAHYCIMVRVPWPTEYKYASAIGCASWRAPLGIDFLPTTTCDRRRNAEPMASAFPRSRRGHGRPSNKQRDQTTRTSALTEITPYKCLDELNAWLLDRCVAYAKAHKHPEIAERTIWQVFEAERSQLVPVPGRFDGFHATTAAVSKTCLVRFDSNKYSVSSRAVGRPVEIQAYADRIVIRQDGAVVGEHARSFGRGETIYDPWHYVPVLARKPGALRNGAPFQDWVLPCALDRVRRKLKGSNDGDRQMVAILSAVLADGLSCVEAACAEALEHGVHSADVILNILARKRDPAPAATIMTPEALRLRHAPVADCARYDDLRRAG